MVELPFFLTREGREQEQREAVVREVTCAIRARLGNAIRSLHVVYGDEGIVLTGRTSSYNDRMMATFLANDHARGKFVQNDIEVR
jgi:hypothetical protein